MISTQLFFFLPFSFNPNEGNGRKNRMLQPAQVCDILKGLLFASSFFLVDLIDTSRLYHMVRGQAVIKLYVFYNMLDVSTYSSIDTWV